jgi:hypothetical protein
MPPVLWGYLLALGSLVCGSFSGWCGDCFRNLFWDCYKIAPK